MSSFFTTIDESANTKAKGLLKSNEMAQGKNDHARGMRAYLRAVANGRDADYLLTQKSAAGKGAQHAKKLLGEGTLTEAYKSRKKLYDALKEINAQGIKSKLPSDYKQLANEIYGRKAMIYLTWISPDARKRGEQELVSRGFRVHQKYSPGSSTSEIQVAYFKGHHWNEDKDRDGESALTELTYSSMTGPVRMQVDALIHKWLKSTGKKLAANKLVDYIAKKVPRADIADIKRRMEIVTEAIARLHEMDLSHVDDILKGIRKSVVRGSKATRHSRLSGCLKRLPMRAKRTGGIKVTGQSHTELNPVPKRERDSEDQPIDRTPGQVDENIHHEETTMNLADAIDRFRNLDEANIPAPKVSRPQAGGGTQLSPKSKFDQYKGADTDYHGGSISVVADPAAMKAEPYYGKVDGPGYAADAREKVDVRQEQLARARQARLEQQRSGRDHPMGIGVDDFETTNWDEDLAFANDMMGFQTEANIPAPNPGATNAGGKQLAPKSRFAKPYKGPGVDYKGDAANIAADPEAMAAAERSTAGVSGPGYGPGGREEVDIRNEDEDSDLFDPTSVRYPDELIQR